MSFGKIESALLALMEGKVETSVVSPGAAPDGYAAYEPGTKVVIDANGHPDHGTETEIVSQAGSGIGGSEVPCYTCKGIDGPVGHNELKLVANEDTQESVVENLESKDSSLNENSKEEKEEPEETEEQPEGKESADQVDQEPAVTVDNPIDPTLDPSETSAELPADEEDNEGKKEVKESTEDTLSEEFQKQAEAIFEAKVEEKAAALMESFIAETEKKYEEKLNESVQLIENKLFDKINEYFGVLSEQWMKDNELALEASIKSDLTESFIHGMKQLFESHYVDLPVEKFDIVNSLEEQLAKSRDELTSTQSLLEETTRQLNKAHRDIIMENATKGMTEIDSSKFRSLMEDFEFESNSGFEKRVESIKESFFGGKQASASISDKLEISTETLVEEKNPVDGNKSPVSVYSEYIRKTAKK